MNNISQTKTCLSAVPGLKKYRTKIMIIDMLQTFSTTVNTIFSVKKMYFYIHYIYSPQICSKRSCNTTMFGVKFKNMMQFKEMKSIKP